MSLEELLKLHADLTWVKGQEAKKDQQRLAAMMGGQGKKM